MDRRSVMTGALSWLTPETTGLSSAYESWFIKWRLKREAEGPTAADEVREPLIK